MKNILGGDLEPCSVDPMTGYFRDGCCRTGSGDYGVHAVCAVLTDEFLAFSKAQGNDLSTPNPQYNFPGLKAGDRWCLCAPRWHEAWQAGMAPKIVANATHISALEHCDGKALREHAIDL
jgi:uncharacterized protein (DUF2237 family)